MGRQDAVGERRRLGRHWRCGELPVAPVQHVWGGMLRYRWCHGRRILTLKRRCRPHAADTSRRGWGHPVRSWRARPRRFPSLCEIHSETRGLRACPGPRSPDRRSRRTPGAGLGSQASLYAYQWQRCNREGGECAAISGATSSTYVLASADAGKTVRVLVTASEEGANAGTLTSPGELIASEKGPVLEAAPGVSGTGLQKYRSRLQPANGLASATATPINGKSERSWRSLHGDLRGDAHLQTVDERCWFQRPGARDGDCIRQLDQAQSGRSR